jgi:hypothetical protein
MTGNVVLLGFGIAGSGGLPVLAPVISLASFLLGAGAAAILARRREAPQPQDIARALSIEATAVGIAAVLAAVLTVRAGAVSGDIVIALLAFAMGVRNATVRRLAVPDLTTTVLTMTLTALAVESPLAGGTGSGDAHRSARRRAAAQRQSRAATPRHSRTRHGRPTHLRPGGEPRRLSGAPAGRAVVPSPQRPG